jgi:hypothetical protein
MTGFIKPAELHAAQELLVEYMESAGDGVNDIPAAAHQFLLVHPVTKKKENKPFRKVNGVYVTEEDFREAEKLTPALNEIDR